MPESVFTIEQYRAVKAAYAQGVTRVEYGDKKIEYRSIAEMERILAKMESELGIGNQGSRRKYISHNKGLI